jgi:2-oxoglutarate/2-oxoacid ferredoxin oxidoreductase subunit alpha
LFNKTINMRPGNLIVNFQISVAGEAGQGIARSADIIARDFASRGFYVFNYRDYGSLIKGGENFNLVRVGTEPVRSNNWKSDYAVVFGRFSAHHVKRLERGGVSIGTVPGVKARIDTAAVLRELKAPKIAENSVLLGALYRSMGQPLEFLLRQLECFGKHSGMNKKAATHGYELYGGPVRPLKLPKRRGTRYFVSGSEAVSLGAVAAGMDVYIAYPMTPATPVLHILAGLKGHDISVVQLENEIGVANAALGASYAGASAMVGTSSGGYALMTETLSLQGMSELPLVLYLAMRPGPATGVPTYTSQGDLKFALYGGHGEFPRVVMAPGDPLEAFERMPEAFYLANRYRTLSVVLSDKHLAESGFTFDSRPRFRVRPQRFLAKPGKDYKSYRKTADGVPPRAPAGRVMLRATSYEHDECGYTVEDVGSVDAMVENRLKKFRTIEKAVSALDPVRVHGRGRNLVVGWGSTKGAILDALKQVKDARFLQICYLKPFPAKKVKRALESSRKVVLVENSATGQMADVVAEHTGHFIGKKVLKYDGRPFGGDELAARLRRAFR